MSALIIKFLIGVLFLIFSSRSLVKLVVNISKSLKISPLIIGTTIVAIGTSLPELVVSAIALTRHDSGLAIGNIVGSNIINVLFVFPAGILVGKLRIGNTKTQRNAFFLLAITTVFLISQIMFPSFIAGIGLITLALVITIVEYKWAENGRMHEDSRMFEHCKKKKLPPIIIFELAALAFGITLGGILVVSSAESISMISGYSTTIIGLSLTAIVTSLPELLTTIFSQKNGEEKVTTGDIIGSNIYNLLLIGGMITVFSPKNTIRFNDWLWLFATTAIFFYILRKYKGKNVPKFVGMALLFLLFSYFAWLYLSRFI